MLTATVVALLKTVRKFNLSPLMRFDLQLITVTAAKSEADREL